jgi:mycofactocin system transcriptional regulator
MWFNSTTCQNMPDPVRRHPVPLGNVKAELSLPVVGRPPSTTRRQLQLIAVEMFSERGYDQVTIEDLATAAGISRRTFFRYFPSKADALMGDFDEEVEHLREALHDSDPNLPVMEAIRTAVVAARSCAVVDPAELRRRLLLQYRNPVLLANALTHYEILKRVVAEFAAGRLGQSLDALLPQAIAGAVYGVADAAYQSWMADPTAELGPTLDGALAALASGFDLAKGKRAAGPRPSKPKRAQKTR